MPNRRHVLKGAAMAAATVATGGANPPLAQAADEPKSKRKGRVNQSVVFWCFNARGDKWSAEKTCEVAKELGVPSVEIIAPEDWPTLKKHGLVCAIAPNGMPGAPFMRGFNNTKFHAELLERPARPSTSAPTRRFPASSPSSATSGRTRTTPSRGRSLRRMRSPTASRG